MARRFSSRRFDCFGDRLFAKEREETETLPTPRTDRGVSKPERSTERRWSITSAFDTLIGDEMKVFTAAVFRPSQRGRLF